MSCSEATRPFPIKTVVVLIQENRSFDHMLGWMKTLNPEIDGVSSADEFYNSLSTTDPSSKKVYFGDQSNYIDPDPAHSFQAICEQVFGSPWGQSSSGDEQVVKMNGFAQNAETTRKGLSDTVMNGFRPEALPVYRELVSQFAVCDHWFSSAPTFTQPNRLFVHSATSHGLITNDVKKLVEGFPQKTIFDSLDEAGFTFGIYNQQFPFTLFYRNLRKHKYKNNFHNFDVEFKSHCKEGKLPNYVVIEQRYFDLILLPANDDHPPHDVSQGQKFVKEVYEALRTSPQWNEILFIITYDEHGGFYDHVPTPTGVPSPDDIASPEPFNFNFDRLGVRVPTIFISPWIERGTVLHRPLGPYLSSEFEHSSIPATVKKIFNLKEFLTKRDAWAGTFETVLMRESPRTDCPVTLPLPLQSLKLQLGDANERANLSEFQAELVRVAATLKRDYKKDIYPEKLVVDMTVKDAAAYCEDAFKKFLEGCGNAQNGAGESKIILLPASP
ncbi:PREDICTED: non-specific phospholipase C4-like [Nelumbo nucifera]|uniref:Non-specific phospholipase C4-like n=1 Tax=Nelumbo nucifera TaxID=4432 RepID=A0A1U8A928_NELNU|nr:PREDICTED: non-specific phospholipase C4-like [Nelumbo nucifera]